MKEKIIILLLLLVASAGVGFYAQQKNKQQAQVPRQDQVALLSQQNQQNSDFASIPTSQQGQVLGESVMTPRLYISGGKENYYSGGLIALSSEEEPAVEMNSHNLSGEVNVDVYRANENALLNFLIHDKDGNQQKVEPPIKDFTLVKSFKTTIANNSPSRVLLPIDNSGIWYLNMSINGLTDRAFVIRSKTGTVVKEGNGQFVFWSQDFKTKKSITSGTIKTFSLLSEQKELASGAIGSDGVALLPFTDEADIAMVYNGNDYALVPVNLRSLNSSYNYKPFQKQSSANKYFLFTDRPIYRPGDVVNFKSIVRDDADGLYNIPSGQLRVKVYKDWNENDSVFEKLFSISKEGTIDGQIQLPKDAATGDYQVKIGPATANPASFGGDADYAYFNVQFYRKPEYSLDISASKISAVAGDKLPVTISGSYFFGQPLAGQIVSYKVYAADYYDYYYSFENSESTLSDQYRYGFWGGSLIADQEVVLNDKGQAEIMIDTRLANGTGQTKVFSVEATFSDESQNLSFSRKNLLVYGSEFSIYQKNWTYGVAVGGTINIPLVLVSHFGTSPANIKLTAKVRRENWVPYNEPGHSYYSYRQETEDLPDLAATTDASGNAAFSFKALKPGSYRLTVLAKDGKGNLYSEDYNTWVSSGSDPYFTENNGNLSIKTDKDNYKPGDTAKLFITSAYGDRDVFLSLQRGTLRSYKILKMKGKLAIADVSLGTDDVPYIIAVASSFNPYSMDRGSQDIKVSAEGKKLEVSVTPQQQTFGPGETVTLNVETKDSAGNPIAADVAVWAVDKALFELADSNLRDIFQTFWGQRYDDTQENNSLAGILTEGGAEKGGCFAPGTQITMANGTYKNIQDVKVGDMVLSWNEKNKTAALAKVTALHNAEVSGYLILNGNLKVTVNHIINLNGTWQQAGNVQPGDVLLSAEGKPGKVESVEWQGGKFPVYNFTVEKYHNYFAENYLVHNDKGGGSRRSVFKDTAYWNPSVKTNASGRAQVKFVLPDNLTTWVISGVGITADTKVGQKQNEITVTKDVVIRPILPNILRTGDSLLVSAIVQNFTEQDHEFNVDLKFDSGDVEAVEKNPLTIKSKGLAQVYWKLKPNKAADQSKMTFSAKATDSEKYQDAVVQLIPVRLAGFWDKNVQVKSSAADFSIKLAPDAVNTQTKIEFSFAPTLLGTLPQAMKYLVDYPYGCVEQTTSRFVPAVIARSNKDLFAGSLEGKNIDEIITTGIASLKSLQQNEGGWQWWHEGNSNAFITSYVLEYLVQAKAQGYKVDDAMLQKAEAYLLKSRYFETDGDLSAETPLPTVSNGQPKLDSGPDMVSRVYGLAMLNSSVIKKPIVGFDGLTPDLVAMAAIANNKNGFTAARDSALLKLRSMAKTQGDSVYWEAGQGIYFGSKDASTAWAMRALVTSSEVIDKELARKAGRYLVSSRKQDYWSNTFATAQVIRAVTELAKQDQELNPNYSYTVSLDGVSIKTGTVKSYKDNVTLVVPSNKILKDGSVLSVVKNGQGQMYSTLLVNQFRTNLDEAQADHGIRVEKKYINNKGEGAPIGVGDLVTVQITVKGLQQDDTYGAIDDDLPSGLVPVNRALNNEQGTEGAYGYSSSYYSWYYPQQFKENGVVIATDYYWGGGDRVYTHLARAVSEGDFIIPSTNVQLMYKPEVNGRSSSGTLHIVKSSQGFSDKLNAGIVNTFGKRVGDRIFQIVFGIITLIVLIVGGVLGYRSWRKKKNDSAGLQDQNLPPGGDDQGSNSK